MPSVDIPTPTDSGASAGSKQGFGTGLPTPVLLAVVGGGIGLVVFLMRKQGTNTGTGADKNTLLPNTAIMLGSLQQGILQLQGDVTQGNADMSSQLTGVGESLGTQIDVQSGQIQQSFADLNTFLSGNLQTIQGNETALSQAIAGLGSQNADLATGITSIIGNLNTMSANNQAALAAGFSTMSSQIAGVSGQVALSQADLVNIQGGIQAIQNGQNATQSQIGAIGRFLGWEFYQLPNRYSAYIPNQQPGGSVAAGSSVIGSV